MSNQDWIDNIGKWNPQFLRECRRRLKARNIIASVFGSLIVQILIFLLIFQSRWEWQVLWQVLFYTLPLVLLIGGSYNLSSDFAEEKKQDKLNFLRLTPRPAWQILLGKILGVPILTYIVVLCVVPLHILATYHAQMPWSLLISFYLILILSCGVFYPTGILLGTSKRLVVFFVMWIFYPIFLSFNTGITWRPLFALSPIDNDLSADIFWFYFPINRNVLISHIFCITNLLIVSFLLWRIILRRFQLPTSTLISKRQSYGILAYIQIQMLGFNLNLANSDFDYSFYSVHYSIFILILVLTILVSPKRQAILDWVKYGKKSGLSDLIWSDRSPAIVTVLIFILIVNGILLPISILVNPQNLVVISISFLSVSNLLVIFGLLIQQVYLSKIRYPSSWIIGILILWFIVLPMILALLRMTPDKFAPFLSIWTLIGYPYLHFQNVSSLLFCTVGIVCQWFILGYLWWRWQKTLRKLQKDTHTISASQ